MSIENIKELFSKRVKESVEINKTPIDFPNNGTNEKEDEQQVESINEIDAGISEYLNDCEGFSAVIKQRFSDFQVHEIDLDGNIAYLTNSDIPVVEIHPVDENVVSEDIWEKIKNLHDKKIETVEIDVTELNKDQRKDIHKAIRQRYGNEFTSNTIEVEDKKTMVVTLGKSDIVRNDWPMGKNAYLHFLLHKSNIDTVDAINIIASKLHTKPANLTYAGTKDKRAKTTQWVSMWHLDAKRLFSVNQALRDMKTGNYIYKPQPLKLGNLKGNLFDIALRNVTVSDEVVNTALRALKENGFVNYYGLQRFGNSAEIKTFDVGRALLQGNFQLACDLILKPRKGKMRNDLRDARKVWWRTKDAARALKCLNSRNRTIEGKLLTGLVKHGQNAFVNALDNIPRNVRLLYLHSYQSYIWNRVLSRRIKEFGKSVLEGDLIFTNENKIDNNDSEEITDTANEMDDPESGVKESVRHLSADEVGNYQLCDIVHPLPGHNITYPNNVIKQWYEEYLAEDDLSSEKLKQTVKQYSLSGTYRLIVQKVKDLSWKICYYSDPEEDLILSDLDILNNVSLNINKNSDNKFKAVVLKFMLESSTYATMALREVLKIDTSKSHQSDLNHYSNKRSNEECDDEARKKNKI